MQSSIDFGALGLVYYVCMLCCVGSKVPGIAHTGHVCCMYVHGTLQSPSKSSNMLLFLYIGGHEQHGVKRKVFSVC